MDLYERALHNAADSVPGAQKQDRDFLGEDGLLYCGKCKTKKQTRIHILGKDQIVPIICQCQQEKLAEERAKQQEMAFMAQVARFREDCFRGDDGAQWTFEADDEKDKRLSGIMKSYAERWEDMKAKKKGMLLYGPPGTGKSFFAACIANALIDKGVSARMTNFAEIVREVQSSFSGQKDYMDNLTMYPLLVIDDLGAERQSDYMQEQVFAVVEERYKTGKPMIVTTNLPLEEIANERDVKRKRIYDRILGSCIPVKIDGESRRIENAKRDLAECKKLLGL